MPGKYSLIPGNGWYGDGPFGNPVGRVEIRNPIKSTGSRVLELTEESQVKASSAALGSGGTFTQFPMGRFSLEENLGAE